MITGRVEVDMSPTEGLMKSLVNKIMRRAMTQASVPVRQAVKSGAPVRTGTLAKSIGQKIKTYPSGVVSIIGPRTDFTRTLQNVSRRRRTPAIYRPSKIAHILERGSRHSKAHPFLRPALQASAFQARLCELLAQGIAAELAKS